MNGIDKASRARLAPLTAIFLAVVLNMSSAVVLKNMADNPGMSLFNLSMGIFVVFAINGVRFFVWGYAHRRYPLSKTYPLISIFFPLMVMVSYLYGESVNLNQIVGAALITVGVIWLTLKVEI